MEAATLVSSWTGLPTEVHLGWYTAAFGLV